MTPSGVYQRTFRPRSHGLTSSPAYKSWEQMIQRCLNPANPSYPRYGGRGITVCQEWRTFEGFLADMGDRPTGTTIDRWPNNNGNYEPGNCRWADAKAQANNRRSSTLVTAFGESKTLAEWESDPRCAVNQYSLQARIARGWEHQRAVETPLVRMGGARFRGKKSYDLGGSV